MSTSSKTNKETAEHLLTSRVPVVTMGMSVGDAIALLTQEAKQQATINYLYVVDDMRMLKGVVSVREIWSIPKEEPIEDHMTRELVTVRPHTDQERAAHLALKHNLKAVPVVDKKGVFLGVVASDTILRVLQAEHTEDLLHLAGVRKHTMTADSLIHAPVAVHVRARAPWLILGLLGGGAAAVVVDLFAEVFANELLLAAFIPAIVYLADAVGSQTQTLFVRALALEQQLAIAPYMRRELLVNICLAALLSLLCALLVIPFVTLPVLLTLTTSVFLTVVAAMGVALFLPWLFTRLEYDAAIASGPLATVVRDILSLAVYLTVAQCFL